MNALVIYSAQGGLSDLANGIKSGLEATGFRVQLKEAEARGSSPVVVASYDLVCVGSPVLGPFGGQVAADIDAMVKRLSRMEGKVSVAFVKPKVLGVRKALTRLMGMLEHQGSWVQDFAALKNRAEAEAFGRRLHTVVRKGP